MRPSRAAPNNIQSARARSLPGMGTSQLLLGRQRRRRRRRHRSTTFGFSSGAPAQHRRAYFLAGKSLAGFDTMNFFCFFLFLSYSLNFIDRSNRSPDIKRRRMYKPLLQGSAHKVCRVYWREGMSKEAGDYIDPIQHGCAPSFKNRQSHKKKRGEREKCPYVCVCVFYKTAF